MVFKKKHEIATVMNNLNIRLLYFYSTDALTFESVALLVVFAILSLLPGLYRNRTSIKVNFIKLKDYIGSCCCKRNEISTASKDITSPEPRSSTYDHEAKTTVEENK